jgi:hypothetical protein
MYVAAAGFTLFTILSVIIFFIEAGLLTFCVRHVPDRYSL